MLTFSILLPFLYLLVMQFLPIKSSDHNSLSWHKGVSGLYISEILCCMTSHDCFLLFLTLFSPVLYLFLPLSATLHLAFAFLPVFLALPMSFAFLLFSAVSIVAGKIVFQEEGISSIPLFVFEMFRWIDVSFRTVDLITENIP